jgi:very-short-patch-repair endonuclease
MMPRGVYDHEKIRGVCFTEEHKNNISKSRTGQRLTDETKRKISQHVILYPRVPWNKGKHGIYSSETIDKLRKARLRQTIPYEYTDIERNMEQVLQELRIDYIHSFNLGDRFLCDFAIPSLKLIIECDGNYWHNLPNMKRRDKAKDAYALKCGWEVFRFSESDLLNNITFCRERVMSQLG